MGDYIQYPRYSIYLIPSNSFFKDLNLFYKKNNLNFQTLAQSTYGIHFTVKAPFYKSHVYSENNLIDQFNSIKKNLIQNIFNKNYNIIQISKFKRNLILELERDPELYFVIHELMRTFDQYRKTLNDDEIKIDLLRFDDLSEKEMMYYQIWGYPYYFECSKHHISLSHYISKFISHDFQPIKYNSLKLLKQEKLGEPFKELSAIIS